MESDLVVQRLANGAMFLVAALLLGLFSTWLVGHVCRAARLTSGLVVLAQLMTPVALFYGGSFVFDRVGAVAAATVESKEERINYQTRIPGSWSRSYWATVRFPTSEGPTPAVLWLDEATFDRLRTGAALDVRYASWFPHIARPASQSTLALVPWGWLTRALVVAGVAVGMWLGLRRRPLLMGVSFFLAIAAGVVWWVFPTPWEPRLAEPTRTAEAEVRSVRDVTRAFLSSRTTGAIDAPQPWQLVELRFVPEGRDEAVTALDGVDEGSVVGLEVGARVPVTYSARTPRDARLAGTRTYRWREWQALGEYVLLIAAVWVGVTLAARLAAAWWRGLIRRR